MSASTKDTEKFLSMISAWSPDAGAKLAQKIKVSKPKLTQRDVRMIFSGMASGIAMSREMPDHSIDAILKVLWPSIEE